MKKLLPLLIVVFAFGKLAAQSIPNGGFENWNLNTWSDPQGYFTQNSDIVTGANATPNVVEVGGWTAGTHGAKLTTELINGDTVPAYITNSIDNPLKFKGGIPYNQKPTGIELWYNCNIAPGDSALFGVIFKKAGNPNPIGVYLYTVTGTVTGYPLLSKTFSPALLATPDTVIFAAASNSGILRNENGSPGNTFTISGVTFLGVASQPVLMNGDFNNWVAGDTVLTPTGWSTSAFNKSYRTTDAYAGNYALQLKTAVVDNGQGVQPSSVSTGKTSNTGFLNPYTLQQDTFEFYYKYISAISASDSGGLNLIFHTSSAQIGRAYALPPSNRYQLMKIPFDLTAFPDAPDSVIANFISWYSAIPGNLPTLADSGSVLEVDNVQFASQQIATAIKPVLLDDNSLLIYPNPAATQFTIASAQSAINEIRLQNILGETILDNQFAQGEASMKQNIDVSRLSPGLYFISIKSGNKISTGKITVSR